MTLSYVILNNSGNAIELVCALSKAKGMTKYMKKLYVLNAVKIVFKVDSAAASLFFVLRFLQALVPGLQTVLIAAFVDQVTLTKTMGIQNKKILLLLFFLVALVAYRWSSKSLTELLEQHMEIRLRAELKPQLVEKISCLKYEDMENGAMRDKISRVNTNIEVQVRQAYSSLLSLLELMIKVVGILVIMFSQVWWLSFAILAVSIPCFRAAMKSGAENYDARAEVTRAERINEYYNEMLKNREYVDERTLFGYQQEYREKYLQQYEKVRKHTTKVRLKWFLKMKAGSMAVILISAFFLAVTIPLTLSGRISFGMFMALTGAVFGIAQNMSWDLTYSIDRTAWYNQYFKDLSEVFALEESKDSERKMMEIGSFSTLEFQNVSFKYPGTEHNILNNLSFQIQAGKKYALVGANGAGKTTIIKLMNGLYQEYEGKILINGEDIRKLDKSFFSNVFQDFARYPVSVRENVTIGRKDNVSEIELEKILNETGVCQAVEKLKDGVETVLGKTKADSQDLSGGEWQKIALARCALSKEPVRILDEPTSSMDPIYESEIYEKFQQISQGKTVLLISHRLSSVKMSDFIFVIEDGTVAEAGCHSALMKKNGLYKQMYEEQAKWYVEEGGKTVHEA